MLLRLLQALDQQQTGNRFTFSVVVADNDSAESARESVEKFSRKSSLRISYCIEPRQNIALARNQALANASGDFVAFIDDDEFPAADWLQKLLSACEQYHADGVLGPVEPIFEEPPPDWLKRGGFYRRPTYQTGYVLSWRECRSGNVLFSRWILDQVDVRFRSQFRTGSEDVDFFRRIMTHGYRFVWCQEAVVFESVPATRWDCSILLKRALLRGGDSLRHPTGRLRAVGKSLLAVPLYLAALPFLSIRGQHLFMKYLVKLCDHIGRLLAIVGIRPVRERPM